jgi:hypothetical protein
MLSGAYRALKVWFRSLPKELINKSNELCLTIHPSDSSVLAHAPSLPLQLHDAAILASKAKIGIGLSKYLFFI